jgi:sugar phosphate permease
MLAIPWLGGMIHNPNFGFDKAMLILGGAIVVFGFLSIFWLKNTPEECGLDPDNKPLTEEEKKGRMLSKDSQVQWTILEVLKNKQAILLILAFGLFYITVTGFAAQIVPYLVEAGYKPPEAIKWMGLTAVCGIIGSLVSGVLDTKLGTKTSSLIYAVVTLLGFAILIFAKSKTAALACLIVEATTMGAIANLIPSFTLQCFGRNSFLSVNRVIFPGVFIVRAITYVFVAYGITHFGGYINTYATFTVFCLVGTVLMFMINDKEVQTPPHKG